MDSQASRGAGIGKAAAFAFGTAALIGQKATQDGHLAAAARQGLDELGAALKAFPDAIQAQEAGTIFNPTQGEIAADRKESLYWPGHVSPSGIVAGRHGLYGPEHGQNGHSPSQIVASHQHGTDDGEQQMAQKTWVEKEAERRSGNSGGNADNDQSEKARERILPEEQQQERDHGRGR